MPYDYLIILHINQNQYLQQMNEPLDEHHNKANRAFYGAFLMCMQQCRFQVINHLIKYTYLFTISIIYAIQSQSSTQFNDIGKCLFINTITSFTGLIIYLMQYFLIFKDIRCYLIIAEQSGHVVVDQRVVDLDSIQNCTSQVIFRGDGDSYQLVGQVDQGLKNAFISQLKNVVQNLIQTKYKWANRLSKIVTLVSIATFVFTIIVLVQNQQIADYIYITLIYYVIVVGITQTKYISALLLLGILLLISPLIIIGFILYCVCRKKVGQYINLPIKKATNSDINNVGGDCSICLLSITLNEDIFVLPCSQKHIFHSTCLTHWIKVRNNCPICRMEIPMTDVQEVGQIQSNIENQQNLEEQA